MQWQYNNEREWQQYVTQYARINGWRVFHWPDSRRTTAGWPDLALIRGNSFLLAELKTNVGKLTRQQLEVHDALTACGIEVHVWRPADETAVRLRLINVTRRR